MIDESTKDWLQRLAYGQHQTEGSEHARRILAGLDDADRDDSTLAAIEDVLPDPDDLTGQIARLVELRGRLEEAAGELDSWNEPEPTDDDLVALFISGVGFRQDVRALLIGTGVLAEDDQLSDPVALLRLFLPSPAAAT